MKPKYEVRKVGDGPAWERWLATFRKREDAESYQTGSMIVNESVEIVEVWDDA